jgi:NADPH:quinone reductase-like Zn-dependent oxidoreductase
MDGFGHRTRGRKGPDPLRPHLSAPDPLLEVLQQLLEGGKVTPLIGRTYPLDDVPAAIRRLAAGHTRGKIVITV